MELTVAFQYHVIVYLTDTKQLFTYLFFYLLKTSYLSLIY
jgi:hypothetical protein